MLLFLLLVGVCVIVNHVNGGYFEAREDVLCDENFPDFTNQAIIDETVAIPMMESSQAEYAQWKLDITDNNQINNLCNFRYQCQAQFRFNGVPWDTKILPKKVIPEEIGLFHNLRSLSLGCRFDIEGGIPESIGNLTKLERLEISSCNLDGNIPWHAIKQLKNLKVLKITERCHSEYSFEGCCQAYSYDRRFNGDLPHLRSGVIPEWVNSFTSIIPDSNDNTFDYGFTNEYPHNEGEAKQSNILCYPLSKQNPVDEVQIYNFLPNYLLKAEEPFTEERFNGKGERKYFSGNLTSDIGELTSLEVLELTDVFLEGYIPKEIGLLTNLKTLRLRFLSKWDNFNRVTRGLSGNIPLEVSNLSNLTELLVHGDVLPYELSKRRAADFDGEDVFTGLQSIALRFSDTSENRQFGLTANNFNLGTFLTSWQHFLNRCQREQPEVCGVDYDREKMKKKFNFNGYAFEVDEQFNLPRSDSVLFDLFQTPFGGPAFGLEGSLPEELGLLRNLTILSLAHHDGLVGTIPSSFSNLSALETLYILNTNLEGIIGAPNFDDNFYGRNNANFRVSTGNTLAYNKFSGCIDANTPRDMLGTLSEFFSDGASQVTTPFDLFDSEWLDTYNLQSVPISLTTLTRPVEETVSDGNNFGDQQKINFEAQGYGTIQVNSGIPQKCFNTNATMLQRCGLVNNEPASVSEAQTSGDCVVTTDPLQKAALIKFHREFTNNYLQDFDILADACASKARRRVYRSNYLSSEYNATAESLNDIEYLGRRSVWPIHLDPCIDTWPGVTCDVSGNIIGLQLSGLWGFHLEGSMPAAISNLTSLVFIDFSFNEITSIPPEISELTALKRFDIAYNNLETIPDELITLSNQFQQVNTNIITWAEFELMISDNAVSLANGSAQGDVTKVAPEDYQFIMNHLQASYFLNSLEGNNITETPEICSNLEVDCTILGLGDGECSAFSRSPNIGQFIFTGDAETCYGRLSKVEKQFAAASLNQVWACELCDINESVDSYLQAFLILSGLLIVTLIILSVFSRRVPPGVQSGVKIIIAYLQIVNALIVAGISIPPELEPWLLPFNVVSFSIPNANIGCLTAGGDGNGSGFVTFTRAIIAAEPGIVLIGIISFYLGVLAVIAFGIRCNRCNGRRRNRKYLKKHNEVENFDKIKQPSRLFCCCLSGGANDNLNTDIYDGLVIKIPALVMIPMSSAMARSFVRIQPYLQLERETDPNSVMDINKVTLDNVSKGGTGWFMLFTSAVVIIILVYFKVLYDFLIACDLGKVRPHRSAFLIRDYKPKLFYWFAVELALRVCIATSAGLGVSVFVELGFAGFFLFVQAFLHFKKKPYLLKATNQFQDISLISQGTILILLLIWYVIQISVEEESDVGAAVYPIAVFTILTIYVALFGATSRFAYKAVKENIYGDMIYDEVNGYDGEDNINKEQEDYEKDTAIVVNKEI